MKQYIQPFIKVCKSVFRDFLNLELEAKVPYLIDKNQASEWDLSAIIGLSGEARGAVVISMKQELAIKLTSILTGKPDVITRDEIIDAVGEIVNIVAGNVKYDLESSFKLFISLPTIIEGKEHTISWPDSQPKVICIPFAISQNEKFSLAVALDSVKKG